MRLRDLWLLPLLPAAWLLVFMARVALCVPASMLGAWPPERSKR
jgi:hypothetical protein